MKFCSACGHEVVYRVPDDGDHLPRHVCPACKTVHYLNPKLIVGVIPEAADGRILMCKRNIEPRFGKWTFPAGFMELGETSAQGAAREALEESQAEVEVDGLVAVINVPYVDQVHLIHRGQLRGSHFGPTSESSEVRLMREEDIPWEEIAFPTIYRGLRYFFDDRRAGRHSVHTLDLIRRPTHEDRADIGRWLSEAS
jgi:ADP-ribose pyrophosphatase YjhB (NUDIX family)